MSEVNRPRDWLSQQKRHERRIKDQATIFSYDPEDKPGKVQGVNVAFRIREKKTKLEYAAKVTWDLVGPGFCEGDIDHYDVQLRMAIKYSDPGHNNPADFTDSTGEKWWTRNNWRRKGHVFVEDLDDEGELDDPAYTFEYIPHRDRWAYQARVRVVDTQGRRGKWSDWCDPVYPEAGSNAQPPTPTVHPLEFERHSGRKHEPRWKCVVTMDEVGPWDIPPEDNNKEDVQPKEDDVRAYQVELTRVNPNVVDNVVTNKYRQLGKKRSKTIPSKPEEDDRNDIVRVTFPSITGRRSGTDSNGQKRGSWYQARARTIDRFNRHGKWSNWTLIGSPLDDRKPPKPSALLFVVEENRFVLDFEAPEDIEDVESDLKDRDPDIAGFQCQIATDPGFNDVIRKDRFFTGQHRVFHYPKIGGTYWARVRSIDGSGNRSDWEAVEATSKIPPMPSTVPTIGFDGREPAKNFKYRALVRFAYDPDNYKDARIDYYVVQAQFSSDNKFTDTDGKKNERVDDDEEKLAIFRRVKAKDYVRARFRAVDRQGRKSPWSSWSSSSRATGVAKPTPPQRVHKSRTLKMVGIKIDPAPDTYDADVPDRRTVHYRVQVSRDRFFNSIVHEDAQVVQNRIYFPVEKADVKAKTKFWTRVAAVDDEGIQSDWIYDTQTQLPPYVYNEEGQDAESVDGDSLDDDSITEGKLHADAIRVKHKIIGSAFMTSDKTNEPRIVIKDVNGANDVIQFFGRNNGAWVGSLKADSGDILGSGDWAFSGLQFSNNNQTFPAVGRNGWARIYLDHGDVWIAMRRTDGSVERRRLAWHSNDVPKHEHTEFAPSSHNHDDIYFRQWEVRDKLNGKSDTGHGHGQHRHGVFAANDGHAHTTRTDYSGV